MYYLYKRKQKRDGSVSGSSASGLAVSLQTPSLYPSPQSTSHGFDHDDSSSSDSKHSSISQKQVMNRRRRPGAEEESFEAKDKDAELARRMLRRRGLEESDFTEEVMQPHRPRRIACQCCRQDIRPDDCSNRIMCNGRERHVFCGACVVSYVEQWIRGEHTCELILNAVGPSRGIHALPCMLASCRKGCFPEVHLQLLLPSPVFSAYHQRIAQIIAEEKSCKQRPAQDQCPQTLLQPHQQYVHPPRQQQVSQLCQNQQQLYQQDEFLLQQQQLEERQTLQLSMLQQNQKLEQHQTDHTSLPLPPALRRSSSTSTTKTGTTKNVRFSIMFGEMDVSHMVDEESVSVNSSSSSSNSSHTAHDAGSATNLSPDTDNGETELDSLHPLDIPSNSHQDPDSATHHENESPVTGRSSMATCLCCYESFDSQSNAMTTCNLMGSSATGHTFCSTCVRLYIEEWLFGAATYCLRSGHQENNGQTALVLPCLYGECDGGSFSDSKVAELLTARMYNQYLERITSLRVDEDGKEEKLVRMAIRMSLAQSKLEKRVAEMIDDPHSSEIKGDTKDAGPTFLETSHEIHVPETYLSTTSSLTSSTFQKLAAPAPQVGSSTMQVSSKVAAASEKVSSPDQHEEALQKHVHEVEEAMTSAKVRQCPNCDTKFLKDKDFCNKLKCPRCKTAVCYVCRHIIPKQGYEHFCIHEQGGCADCFGRHCPLWTMEGDDDQRDFAEMKARGLDEANRIWEQSLLHKLPGGNGREIRVDVNRLLQRPPSASGADQ